MHQNQSSPTPVTIFVGFLGSGKTTIISNLIKQLKNSGQKVAYIKNELGFEDLDVQMIENVSKKVIAKTITIGTLHHAPLGPLRELLHQIKQTKNPDRIIIETAGTEGTADPVSLQILVNKDPDFFCDGLFKIIDVENFEGYAQLEAYTKDKTKFIDFVLLNKIEKVSLQRRKSVVGYIREYNEVSPILEATQGSLNLEVAFGVNMHEPNSHHHSSQDVDQKIKLFNDHISGINYISEAKFDSKKIEAAFAKLPSSIFRVKGFINTQNGVKIFNGVNKRFDWLENTESNQSTQTKLIIVGSEVLHIQDEIFSLFDECKI